MNKYQEALDFIIDCIEFNYKTIKDLEAIEFYCDMVQELVDKENPMKHNKKILSKYFKEVILGNKTFEIRKEDDCKYEVGDLIKLNEVTEIITHEDNVKPLSKIVETGESLLVEVTYRLDSKEFPEGIKPGYVVLGIKLRSDDE